MKLLVIVLCLLSERYLMHAASFSRFYWFGAYIRNMEQISAIAKSITIPWVGLMLLILPIFLPIFLIWYLIDGFFYNIFNLLFNLAVFYYCLGPANPFYPAELQLSADENQEQVVDYLYLINRQLFSTIFWYVIAGIPGALLHRLATLCISVEPVSHEAKIVTDIMEWLPARMSGFLYLLTGNFQRGFTPWKNLFFSGINENHTFLAACGLQALRSAPDEPLTVTLAESMVNQALIVLLVILALFTCTAWL